MFSYILFDLDGTISDPKIGITSCVQYALKSYGINEPDLNKLTPFIGPPLRDSFMHYYGFSPMQAQAAVDKYRERFSAVGKFENELYPGITALLAELKAAGAHLAIASSKPGVYVEDILVHFGIRQYFEIVVGSELNGTREKKVEVLEEVMRRLGQLGMQSPGDAVMVGDRRFDIEGARAVGSHSVAVTYGYAQPGELEAAGPDFLVHSVSQLRSVLLDGNSSGAKAFEYNGSLYNRYRTIPDRKETPLRRGLKALGMCALAVGTYFLINAFVATVAVMVGFNLTDYRVINGVSSEDFWLNMGNAAGILAGFAVCICLWHRELRVRPAKPVDRLSLIPMVVASAALAMGLNGAITLSELYKYSPAFQEVAALQTETPLWLGILSFGILAPLGEELVFRGLVYGNLKKICPVWAAILMSGLVFGLFHGNLVQGVYAALLGCVFAWAYELYGTILVPMLMHSVANLFVYLLLDCTEFGAVFVTPLPCIFMLVSGLIGLGLMAVWQKSAERK